MIIYSLISSVYFYLFILFYFILFYLPIYLYLFTYIYLFIFYFMLFYFMLFHFISFYVMLFYFISFYVFFCLFFAFSSTFFVTSRVCFFFIDVVTNLLSFLYIRILFIPFFFPSTFEFFFCISIETPIIYI